MNKNLTEAIFDCNKADALMYAIEAAYIVMGDSAEGKLDKIDRAEHAFYALWDAIHKVQDDLECMAAENVVCYDKK